jgi:hypothetical protein
VAHHSLLLLMLVALLLLRAEMGQAMLDLQELADHKCPLLLLLLLLLHHLPA